MKNYRKFKNNIHASGLPLRRELKQLSMTGVLRVIDLTERPRLTAKRACESFNMQYFKFPINDFEPDIDLFREAKDIAEQGDCLIYCFKGIHRTGILLQMLGLEKIKSNDFLNHKKMVELCLNNCE